MQEHVAATDSGRQQRAIASTLATTGAGHPLLVEQATQIRVDQTAFHSPDRLAQDGVGQSLARLPPGKVSPLEDTGHPDLQTIPDTGIDFHASYKLPRNHEPCTFVPVFLSDLTLTPRRKTPSRKTDAPAS